MTTPPISSLILLLSRLLYHMFYYHTFFHVFLLLPPCARAHTQIYKTCRSGRFRHAVPRRAQYPVSSLFPSLSLPPSVSLRLSLSLTLSLFSLHVYFLSLSLVRRYLGLLLSEFVNATFMCKGLFDLKAENATKGESERTRERAERARTHRMERGKEGESLHSLGSTSLPTGLMWGHRDPYWPNWGHSINEF
jgi:hypothetical protein